MVAALAAVLIVPALLLAGPSLAEEAPDTSIEIDYAGFEALTFVLR